MQDCYFPFTFEFESYVKDFTINYMSSITTPSATLVFHDTIPKSLRTLIDEELASYGIPALANINIWKKEPGYEQVLHTDLYAWDVVSKKSKTFTVNHSALNIPITGTAKSDMVWYGGKHVCIPTTIITVSKAKATYFKVEWEEEPFVKDKLELLDSHFVCTSIPHRVFCNPDDTRIIISLRFQGNPTFDTIQQLMK